MFYNSEIKNISDETFAQALNLVESRLQLQHCTEPANRRNAEEAMDTAYRSAGLAPPKILWCNSPLEAYLAKAILCTLNSDELSREYKGLSISQSRIAQIRGDCVRHNIRDDLLYNLADSFYSKLSELVRSRLLAAMSQRIQLTSDEFSFYSRTIEETVNRIAYIENARAVKFEFGNHIHIPDSTWEAACISAETIMGKKIPAKLRSFEKLSCERWPYFFNSMRDSRYHTGYGAHDTNLLVTAAIQQYIQFSSVSSKKFDPFVRLGENAGWYLPFKKVCWISERHSACHVDERGRPHNASGPAISFRDGWNLWEWHGIRVNEHIIMRPDEITVADIEHESNAEVRSVLLERFGEERYFTAGAMEAVDDDPKYGTLLKRKGPVQMMMVRVVNSTCEPDGSKKTYLLRVPEWMRTAREAVAWTFGMNEHEYKPIVET